MKCLSMLEDLLIRMRTIQNKMVYRKCIMNEDIILSKRALRQFANDRSLNVILSNLGKSRKVIMGKQHNSFTFQFTV